MGYNLEIVIRLIVASVLGGLVGLDRESTNRPAGFRTHTLVSVGSALIMLVSIDSGKYGGDPSRIAAQVVSGIGFLGAGTILRTRTSVEGLTTAASLWVCAGIGLAIGSGYYLGAIVTTVAVLFFLRYSKSFERKLFKTSYRNVIVLGLYRAGYIGDIGTLFGKHNIIIKNISITNLEEEEVLKVELYFNVKLPRNIDFKEVINELYLVNGTLKITSNDSLGKTDDEDDYM